VIDFTKRMSRTAQPAQAPDSDQVEALRFVLCGRIDHGANADQNKRYQEFRIHPELDRPEVDVAGDLFRMTARVQTVFAVSGNIDIAGTLTIHPVTKFDDRFSHVAAPWFTHRDRAFRSDSIPSFCLGTGANGSAKVWVALPKLLDPVHPTLEIPERLYSDIRTLVQHSLGALHDTNMKHMRGVMALGVTADSLVDAKVRVLPAELVHVSRRLKVAASTSRHPALRELVFITEVSTGDKLDFQYTVGDVSAQTDVFSRVNRLFEAQSLVRADMAISVHITAEIDAPEFTLRVKTDRLTDWLRWFIPTLTQGEAEVIKGHPAFVLRPAAGVRALSGFQWRPDPAAHAYYHNICQYAHLVHADARLFHDLGLVHVRTGSLLPQDITDLQRNLTDVCERLGRRVPEDRHRINESGGLLIELCLPIRLAQISMSRRTLDVTNAWLIPYESYWWR
jgi:hypothetical protein